MIWFGFGPTRFSNNSDSWLLYSTADLLTLPPPTSCLASVQRKKKSSSITMALQQQSTVPLKSGTGSKEKRPTNVILLGWCWNTPSKLSLTHSFIATFLLLFCLAIYLGISRKQARSPARFFFGTWQAESGGAHEPLTPMARFARCIRRLDEQDSYYILQPKL